MKHAKKAPSRRTEDERWSRDIATLRQAAQKLAQRRNEVQRSPGDIQFNEIAELLDDPSAAVREKAVRDLYELDADRAATLVNDALRDGSPEERRRIGSALADSGLLYEAIDDLIRWLRRGPSLARVTGVEIDDSLPPAGLEGFTIRP